MLLIGETGTGRYLWSCRSCHFATGVLYDDETEARRAFRKHRAWQCPLTRDKQ